MSEDPARPDQPSPRPDGTAARLRSVLQDQRVLFLLVGAVNTLNGTLWFALIDALIGRHWNGFGHYVALVLTYVIAILTAFVLYRRLVFRVHGNVVRDLLRFSSVYIGAFVVNVVLFAILHNGFGMAPLLAQVINVGVATILSFVLHKNYSFRRPAETRTEASRS